MKPSFFRLMVKDMVDFAMVFLASFGLTLAIYFLSPRFTTVELSFYFFEQFIELFFANPGLVMWFFGLGLGVSIIYFLFSAMLFNNTFGGHLLGLRVMSIGPRGKFSLLDSVLMAIGAYLGVLCLFLGPLTAFWLDKDHRGWSEKLSGIVFVKNGPA